MVAIEKILPKERFRHPTPYMHMNLGATYLAGSRCQFVVWAPLADKVEVQILDHRDSFSASKAKSICGNGEPHRRIRLTRTDFGYHEGIGEGIPAGTRYVYCLDGKKDRPDPASRFQPEGVHGVSQVIDPQKFRWKAASWRGLSLDDYIIYEVHVGTYTTEGTFDAIVPHLSKIKKLGVTALELMPVAQFPGDRNWGYDGAYPYAVQNSYGGPEGMQRLVEACHEHGLAVALDVVYNHLGPEGNYLGDFGPYFTDLYRSPWSQALNFDGPSSDEVVRYFIENALYWVRDFQIDALRLDAIHGIVDCNAQPFLRLLAQAVHEFAKKSGRKIYLIAESDLNDVRYIQPAESGGFGLDAQWSDDFHHAVHSLLTGDRSGYYLDFGELDHMRKAFEEGFVYSGQFSTYRRRRHGNSSRQIPARQFVVFAQNHDQVGNRLLGDRLSALISFEALKLAAALAILSPFIPLLFMGEEWGERAPFQYFTSHSDSALIEAVRRGRWEEFAAFRWDGEPLDPQDEAIFLRSKLNHNLKQTGPGRALWEFYQELIKVRKSVPAIARYSKSSMDVRCLEKERVLQIHRRSEGDEMILFANFSDEAKAVVPNCPQGTWQVRIDSADRRWGGPGTTIPPDFKSTENVRLNLCPKSISLFQRLG